MKMCEDCIHFDVCEADGMCSGFIEKARFVEALEKRMPKKPNDVGHLGDKDIYKYGKCPDCGIGVNYEMQYCDFCGQALDWSE